MTPRHADALLARATHYLPALAGARAIPVPVGYRPMPRDGFPVLGYPEPVPNLYLALMHSGVTLAPLAESWLPWKSWTVLVCRSSMPIVQSAFGERDGREEKA